MLSVNIEALNPPYKVYTSELTITITDNIKVCSFSSNEKKAKSGTTVELIDTATKPLKPIKKTIGIIIKNEAIKLFFSTLLFCAA